jgi:YD repeat-containing protein
VDCANNNLTSFTDRAGGVTTYQYNASSLPITITDRITNQTVIV